MPLWGACVVNATTCSETHLTLVTGSWLSFASTDLNWQSGIYIDDLLSKAASHRGVWCAISGMCRTYEVINHQSNIKKKNQSSDDHASGGPDMSFTHDGEARERGEASGRRSWFWWRRAERCTCAPLQTNNDSDRRTNLEAFFFFFLALIKMLLMSSDMPPNAQ